ncbi:MAG: FAD-binding oxidoreductase [Verrucomicrobiales bacterium]|jgi:FAD/FMN-containing dehydrogenase/Fe-S oxidoreductase|nr:FAD-binding oxidoreductase [Verrucomicrobiales bacterium]
MNTDIYSPLQSSLKGEFHDDDFHKILYATDASMYREIPEGVIIAHHKDDLIKAVNFARQNKLSIIPRAAGTSLAGQVVGKGIVVEISKYFNKVLEINEQEHWVRVEPGIIRNDLNLQLKPHGLLFGPETSTANRALIGGMIGNNSCGLHSIVWGCVRDHLISCKAILADGNEVEFKELTPEEFKQKLTLKTLEGRIYQKIHQELSRQEVTVEIRTQFPRPNISRRNNGYAIDLLLRSNIFTLGGPNFNMCQLIAGSEGTLCLITEAKLNLVPLPGQFVGCVAMHFNDTVEALKANVIAVNYKPNASELIDNYTVTLGRMNTTATQNSQWIIGEPKAIIVVEFSRDTREEIDDLANRLIAEIRQAGYGYAYPVYHNEQTQPIWALRNAVLGLMYSKPSDTKPINLVEDCAVEVTDLPEFFAQHSKLIQVKGVEVTTSAHAGTGELHTLPFVNLKSKEGVHIIREILEETVTLVKKYGGSLSGEHGDGRLRAEFTRKMIGEKNYELCQQIKYTWDEQNIFNPNKIVDAPPMDVSLRYSPGQKIPKIKTYFNWQNQSDIVRATELCNGTGECKKSGLTGGIMCPSYMATLDERHSTRGRANIMREFLTNSTKQNRFDHDEIKRVMDLCLSCKACKSECPSSVDVAKLKAEFLQNYYDLHGTPFRSKLIANFSRNMRLSSLAPWAYNFFASNFLTASVIKKISGFAQDRSIPLLYHTPLFKWYRRHYPQLKQQHQTSRSVYLFCDEFSNYNDGEIGIATIQLLFRLGYDVKMVKSAESGRTHLSKGFVKNAKQLAIKNVRQFAPLISKEVPLIGIEPSAISCFKDDYLSLVPQEQLDEAKKLAVHSFMFEEFICREIDAGNIKAEQFTASKREVKVHVHCHQKSVSNPALVIRALSLPKNYIVTNIPTSCCGMAGAFGYEKEHYDVSMQIGNMVLFPTVKSSSIQTIIAASGTSCRHQIKDGTNRNAVHSAEILLQALA